MLVAHPSRSSGCYATGIVCLAAFLFVPEHVWAQKCVGSPLAVQVLGSGGPRINPLRASAGYVLWVDSEARMLVDVGGGTFARFGQSEANFIDLSLVAISHPASRPRVGSPGAPVDEPESAHRTVTDQRAIRERRGARFSSFSQPPLR